MKKLLFLLLSVCICYLGQCSKLKLNDPIVVNTWPFTKATNQSWQALQKGVNAVEAIVTGCSVCELEYRSCGSSVGFGGSPDESGETTLDAMIMDGVSHGVGAVGDLRRVKNAIGVAQAVLNYTKHTLLVGESATQFALSLGFKEENLSSSDSIKQWQTWKSANCQPNFWQNVSPNASTSCGPYNPDSTLYKSAQYRSGESQVNKHVDIEHHDTIAMIAIDTDGNMAAGTTTNGANHKLHGRVGDSPIMGAGAYVENGIGGAAATGDGDVMMRFLPCFETVKLMELGMAPDKAAFMALNKIYKFYPSFSGAIVALNNFGIHGGACFGFSQFQYSVGQASDGVGVVNVTCSHPANH